MLLAIGLKRWFKFAPWTVPAICFNNTTSLPLLLVQTLDATGILDVLLRSQADSTSAAVNRAKSFFLVNSLCGNVLTFTFGPKLLGEDQPNDDEECGSCQDDQGDRNGVAENQNAGLDDTTEQTSLLPKPVLHGGGTYGHEAFLKGKKQWDHLPPWTRHALQFLYAFINAPMIGGILGAAIGLTPPLHRAFFNSSTEGGIFSAWLTTSVKNIGELFAALQVVILGVKLSSVLRKMKRGENSGDVSWGPMSTVLVIRFVLWPLYGFFSLSCLHFLGCLAHGADGKQRFNQGDLRARLEDAHPWLRPHPLVRHDVDAHRAVGHELDFSCRR